MSTSDAVDPVLIEGVYTALGAMQVELDADPLELGPKRLNEKIAQCRGMLSRCETIFLSVSQDLHRYRRSLRAATADFKLRVRELLTNDPEVRMGRNVTDREAIAGNKLRPEAEEIDRLTACVEDLDAVVVIIRTKRADLKDIQGRLKDQLKVCQEELSLGGRWGRVTGPGRRKVVEDPAQESVNELMDNVLKPLDGMTGVEDITPAPDPPEPFMGDPALHPDRVLAALPGEDLPIPEVRHPDEGIFTGDNLDDVLSQL